jgi:hypothetical protein
MQFQNKKKNKKKYFFEPATKQHAYTVPWVFPLRLQARQPPFRPDLPLMTVLLVLAYRQTVSTLSAWLEWKWSSWVRVTVRHVGTLYPRAPTRCRFPRQHWHFYESPPLEVPGTHRTVDEVHLHYLQVKLHVVVGCISCVHTFREASSSFNSG